MAGHAHGRRSLIALLVAGLIAALAFGGISTGPALATEPAAQAPSAVQPSDDIVYFWGEGCPNCAKASEYLDTVRAEFPEITIREYEVWNDADNRDLFAQTAEELNFTAGSVPTIIIGERVWIGWTSQVEQDMAAAIESVASGGSPRPGIYGSPDAGTCTEQGCTVEQDGTFIDVPLAGEVALGEQSLLVSTLLIGFVDGINPCSLWVITVLLVIVVRTGSRRRVIAIGATFLAVTAAMYGLYMAAMYSALAVVGHLDLIQLVVAAAALIFGIVSVKDYFALKKGFSLTIRDSDKPGIFQRARAAAGQRALIPALLATIGLAVAVSLLETPCTAGFPLLWTGMLHANDVGAVETAGLWVAYMVPFLLDEIAIFAVAIVTMRALHMQDKHGEVLKLIAGVTMLVLATVMALDPTLMEDPLMALLLFGAAFVLAGAIHFITTQVKSTRALRAELEAAAEAEDAQVSASPGRDG